jgi:hypothetical protein
MDITGIKIKGIRMYVLLIIDLQVNDLTTYWLENLLQ